MATKIQVRRGLKQDLPFLDNGEMGLAQDTEEVFMGLGYKNKQLADQEDVDILMNFDYTAVQPVYHTNFNLAVTTVLQCYVIDDETGDIYASQVTAAVAAGKTESFTISRMNHLGHLKDSMNIKYGGHGALFGFERENGTLYIWTSYHVVDVNEVTTGYKLVRFPYQAGKEMTITDPTIQEYNRFNSTYTTIVTDYKNDLIAFRLGTGVGNAQTMELRKISDIKLGVNNILGTISIPLDLTYLQGAALDGYDFYLRTGDTNAVSYPDEITKFSFVDGQVKKRISCTFGADRTGAFEGNYREPEGIHLYTDRKSGKKTLFAGLVSGDTGKRIYKSYAYHQAGNGEQFVSDQMLNVQKYEMTKNDGYAKRIPNSITDLKTFRIPGQYYMTTSDSATYTDHPLPNVAGWFLEVSALDTSAGCYQILRRNTSVTANIRVYYRQVFSTGAATDWLLTTSGA